MDLRGYKVMTDISLWPTFTAQSTHFRFSGAQLKLPSTISTQVAQLTPYLH